MHVLHKCMSLFIRILRLLFSIVIYIYKSVMLSVCHSSSKVIQAVYFILLFEMANEGAATS